MRISEIADDMNPNFEFVEVSSSSRFDAAGALIIATVSTASWPLAQ